MNICVRLLLCLAAACMLPPAQAQTCPSKPILMLVPLAAGSSLDVVLRMIMQKMSENMGQQIVVENQPGTAGIVIE